MSMIEMNTSFIKIYGTKAASFCNSPNELDNATIFSSKVPLVQYTNNSA